MEMNPQKIINGMAAKNRLLSDKNDEYVSLVESYAGAEKDYKTALATAILRLKADGHPVTLIVKLAEGDKNVADLRLKMIIAEGVKKACRESMRNAAGAIDTYRSMLTWLRSEKENP